MAFRTARRRVVGRRSPALATTAGVLLAAALAASHAPKAGAAPSASSGKGGSMHLTSTAFANEGEIPAAHTCEGADHPPALAWSDAPAGTKSFALVVDDPDAPDPKAPRTIWVHWVVYNLPTSATGLPAGAKLPSGTREGLNDWHSPGWRGPCPPIGRHRYFFKLYALDQVLPDLHQPTKAALEKAMKGHTLAEAHLMGTYQKR